MCSYGGSRGLQAPERRLAGAASQTNNSNPQPVYSYTVSNYDSAGNLAGYVDSSTNPATGVTNPIMGNWSFTYDPLNRLVSGTASTGTYTGENMCWTYDTFGNRTAQSQQTGVCSTLSSSTFVYSASNQVSGVIPPGSTQPSPSPYTYDQAGDVTIDVGAGNQYLYDGDGRICAVASPNPLGGTTLTGYLYDAEGTRVAKGNIAEWSCDPATSGLTGSTTTNDYILGLSGEQFTEMGVDANHSLVWQHTNVWAGGKLLATYDGATVSGKDETGGLHFYFDDPLGSRRVQTDYAGNIEKTCSSLPYGDAESCAPTPTENLFTGKERDTESGNDYFGARYYASSMGRWMSPDKPFADQHARNPQSWNLYTYSLNNPLRYIDSDGRKVEETRTVSYYPVTGATASQALANANGHSFGGSGDHAGLTTPTMTWHTDTSYSYQTTNGNVTVTTTVTSDTITLNQNVQLPQWDGYSKASPDEQKTWDDAVSKLQGHETDHEDINRAGADALDKSLPGTTSTATGKDLDPTVKASQNNNDADAQNKVDASNQATDQKNKQLDTCTNHGTQACSK